MLYRNATAFYDNAFHSGTDIRTENGKIIEIGKNLTGNDSLDLNGDFLLPGFVDVHIHAYKGYDTMNGEADIRAMSRELRKAGVAAFLPTTMSASDSDTVKALEAVHNVRNKPEEKGAMIPGAHMEAPFMNVKKCGAQIAGYFCEPTIGNWKRYTGPYASDVRMISMAPELPGSFDLISYLTSNRITVSIGHTCASAEDVHTAGDHGANHITHTFNAQTALGHRAPGVPGAALADDRFYCEFISDGIHLHPDIIRLIVKAKGAEKAVAITDSLEAAGMPDGLYHLGGQEVWVRNGAARLADGTLAGSTLTMLRAFRNLMSFGCTPEQAVMMTTQTPADSIGENTLGRIRVGCASVMNRFSMDFSDMQTLE